jgi:VWFA-related protein
MRRAVLLLLLAGVPLVGAAQGPTSPAPQGPTLRASVDQVVVDVVVTDAAGQPVSGLTAADFEIVERGRPQAIATFAEVVLPLVRREVALPSPGDIRTNQRAGESRVYVLLLDDANVRLERSPVVQNAARRFLARYVQPGDLVAVLTTTGLGATRQEPTEDLALVDAAIARFAGVMTEAFESASTQRAARAYASRNADPMSTRRTSTTLIDDGSVDVKDDARDEGRERASLTLRTLENVAESLAHIPGRRKTVLFFSEGPLVPVRDTEMLATEARVLAAAARANMAIYALNPTGLDHPTTGDSRGLEGVPGSLDSLATQRSRDLNLGVNGVVVQRRLMAAAVLQNLAGSTGGVATIDQTNLDGALDRIATDSSHYYLLGYAPADAKREGRYRPIEVRLKKPGYKVSARKGYVEADDKALRKAKDKEKGKGGAAGPLADLIRRPVPTAGLPLSAQAIVLPGGRNNVRVVVEVGPQALLRDGGTDGPATALDLVIVPVATGGQVMPAVEGTAPLGVPGIDAATIRERGLRIMQTLTLAPGRYQLRIAARETGRDTTGSVIAEAIVPAADAGLGMSPLVLSSRQAGRIPSATRDAALETALGGRPPTTARAFDTADTVSAYAELIDAGASTVRPVEVSTVIRTAGGRELVRSPQPNANQGVAAGRSFAYVVDLPLKSLAPGRYTLRVEARVAGESAIVARETDFEVRSAAAP